MIGKNKIKYIRVGFVSIISSYAFTINRLMFGTMFQKSIIKEGKGGEDISSGTRNQKGGLFFIKFVIIMSIVIIKRIWKLLGGSFKALNLIVHGISMFYLCII